MPETLNLQMFQNIFHWFVKQKNIDLTLKPIDPSKKEGSFNLIMYFISW